MGSNDMFNDHGGVIVRAFLQAYWIESGYKCRGAVKRPGPGCFFGLYDLLWMVMVLQLFPGQRGPWKLHSLLCRIFNMCSGVVTPF